MPKPSSRAKGTKSRSSALRRLEPYNRSPAEEDGEQHGGSRHSSQKKARRSKERSRSRSKSHGRSRSPAEPPQWAKDLLKNQEENVKELKRLQGEIERTRAPAAAVSSKPVARVPEPSFKYVGNKTQYELNDKVAEKIDAALVADDEETRCKALKEGKELLSERNKHILLAEKYGWDAVECYTAEPLAKDADDEKRIKKAVKESKQLRDEKRKKALSTTKGKRQYWGTASAPYEQKRSFDKASYLSTHGLSAGKPSVTRNTSPATCFRCLRPGHLARECRAANAARTVTFNGVPPGAAVQQQPLPQ